MPFKLFFLAFLATPFLLTGCGGGADEGLSADVEVAIISNPVVFDSPLGIVNPLDPTEIIQAEPNWFKATYGFVNPTEFDVVLVAIKYEITYSSGTGSLKKVDFSTVPAVNQDYIEVISSGSTDQALENILVYGLGEDNPDLNYQVRAIFKGWFAETGSPGRPLSRFQKEIQFSAH